MKKLKPIKVHRTLVTESEPTKEYLMKLFYAQKCKSMKDRLAIIVLTSVAMIHLKNGKTFGGAGSYRVKFRWTPFSLKFVYSITKLED